MSAIVWFNGKCSKSRGLRDLLAERGVEAEFRHYLEQPPTREELESLLTALGSTDPMDIIRPKEKPFAEKGLHGADRETLLDAIADSPILLQRPILVMGGKAVIARPPEQAESLL